jgi:hypothetical protein
MDEVCFCTCAGDATLARTTPPSDLTSENPSDENTADPAAWDVELLRVLVSRKGTQVDAQWTIHPQLKHDLLPDEWREVTDLMAKVTDIVGHRFSEVLSKAGPASSGHA